ncbi:hypothetical protein LWI28_011617 [Acer negundo]|uniref:RNase H type-1 domain-containing protein n=1 Tax=Acer negundo TaxID=4023 RepID=A0AAD5IDF5_ACENE|nr:hypothetical protein LWI28_011617 [Acer negundo]
MNSCLVFWNPPDFDWVKLNVDGSRNPESGCISAGGVARNHLKQCLVGFALNKGSGSVLEAETWGLLGGLKLVWKAGFRKVVIESDSQSAVALINNDSSMNYPIFNIIQDCKFLLRSNWSCKVMHVYRESNKVASSLANLDHSLDLGTTIFEDPPLKIIGCLEHDFKGAISTRLVTSF